MNLYEFMSEHPVLTVILALILSATLVGIAQAVTCD